MARTEDYEEHATELVASWRQLSFMDRPQQVLIRFQQRPSFIVDIEAGKGVDAAALAALGHQVVAVEPVAAPTGDAIDVVARLDAGVGQRSGHATGDQP